MCGVVGLFQEPTRKEQVAHAIREMTGQLAHRGPDDEGFWIDVGSGVALGHRRLAIVDLSQEGHQPMVSPSERYVISYNGEVYNFADIRTQLEKSEHSFRGHSDTEVMLAAIDEWGLSEAVPRFNGMFAFALWDRKERTLHLVRDRLGVKPLYYGWAGKTFIFGSELKALRSYPGFQGEIDRDSLALFLRYSCVPAPRSIYRGIHKLLPGTILSIGSPQAKPTTMTYWSAKDVAERGFEKPLECSDSEAVAQLEALLRDSVKMRMVADVPLGAFLSGGIDSSAVVALMQAVSDRPVRTFTIGFHEGLYNEARYAKEVARHLGTDHTELYLTPKECMEVIPKLPELYDEPFSDSSQIPTYLVSELARRSVTVSLSGDGGDELFGGYRRYFHALRCAKLKAMTPRLVRYLLQGYLSVRQTAHMDSWISSLGRSLPGGLRKYRLGDSVRRMATILVSKPEAMYQQIMSHWDDPTAILIDSQEPKVSLGNPSEWPAALSFIHQVMLADLATYLPDDILTKVDRASMGVSLEVRGPFLDFRMVELAWRMPLSMKIRSGQGKWILRQMLRRLLPETLVERPKMGFVVPIGQWLRGPLRDWAEELLSERCLREEGFFHPEPIRRKWQLHLAGKEDWEDHFWDILMFQAWKKAACGAMERRSLQSM